MSREIKFRAWDKDRECFLPVIVGNTDIKDDNWICPLTFCEVNGEKNWYHNETCEIMQYTGLHDKNDKEIYEGDIVRIFGMNFEVINTSGSFCIASENFINYKIFEDKILEYTGCDNSPAFSYVDKLIPLFELYWNYNEEENILNCIEVIGNIYDNPPELLGGD